VNITRFVGLDVSLARTGVGIIDAGRGDRASLSIPTSNKLTSWERQKVGVEGILKIIQPKDIVVFEDISRAALYGVLGNAADRLEMMGHLKHTIPKITGLPFLLAEPSILKGFATGKASAEKKKVREVIREHWQMPVANGDEADGYALALLGKAGFIEEDLDPKRKKSLDKFKIINQDRIKEIFQLTGKVGGF